MHKIFISCKKRKATSKTENNIVLYIMAQGFIENWKLRYDAFSRCCRCDLGSDLLARLICDCSGCFYSIQKRCVRDAVRRNFIDSSSCVHYYTIAFVIPSSYFVDRQYFRNHINLLSLVDEEYFFVMTKSDEQRFYQIS